MTRQRTPTVDIIEAIAGELTFTFDITSVTDNLDGTYTLEFQIWNGNSPVDPLGWISN